MDDPLKSKINVNMKPHSQAASNVHAKIALISMHKPSSSYLLGAVLLLIEHAQLMSQALLLRPSLYQSATLDSNLFTMIVFYAAKLVNFSFLLPFNETESRLTTTVLIIFLAWSFLKYFLFGYIVFIGLYNHKGSELFLNLWRWIFKLQGRVFYYLVTSFFVNAVRAASQGEYLFFKNQKILSMAFFCCVIALEFCFTFFLKFYYSRIFPTKDILSSKTNRLQILTLFQKLIIQILQIALPFDTKASDWILEIANLVCIITINYQFYKILPIYNLPSLTLQGCLLGMCFALNLSTIFQLAINSSNEKTYGSTFVAITWTILALLAARIVFSFMKNLVRDLVTKGDLTISGYRLTHKVFIMKKMRKYMIAPSKSNLKYQWSYLLTQTVNQNIKHILNITKTSPSDPIPDITSKISCNKMFLDFLEEAVAKHPKDSLLKLYLALTYMKKFKVYSKAMKLITEVKSTDEKKLTLNALLLTHEIQSMVEHENANSHTYLDLWTYAKSRTFVDNLKRDIVKQTDLQIKVCQEMIQENPDLGKLLDNAQLAGKHRRSAQIKIKRLFEVIPDCYIEPALMCAYYYHMVNHSEVDYNFYKELYERKEQRHSKTRNSDLCTENMYHDDVAFMLVSCQKQDSGKLMYSTHALSKMFGKDLQSLIGSHVSSLCMPVAQKLYEFFFKNIAEAGDTRIINKIITGYGNHKEGYMLPVHIYINTYPYVTDGFYVCAVMRPCPIKGEVLMVHENGTIEGFTKRIGERLGLLQSQQNKTPKPVFNISQISPDLVDINEAFNVVSLPNKYNQCKIDPKVKPTEQIDTPYRKPIPFKTDILRSPDKRTSQSVTPAPFRKLRRQIMDAQMTYSQLTTDGDNIVLFPIAEKEQKINDSNDESENIYNYHCRVSNLFYGATYMKIITLDSLDPKEKQNAVGSPKRQTRIEDLSSPKLKQSILEEDYVRENSDTFIPGDEKEEGWIDFKMLQSEEQEKQINSPRELSGYRETNLTTEGRLLSPKKEEPSVPLFRKFNFDNLPLDSPTRSFRLLRSMTRRRETQAVSPKSQYAKASEAGSQISRISTKRKISKAFNIAVETKSYPKMFKPLCFLVYSLFAALFFVELYLKINLDNNSQTIQVTKDILTDAQNRTYQTANLESVLRSLWDTGSGRITQAEYGSFYKPVSTFLALAKTYLTEIANLNQNIFQNANLFHKDTRNTLFYKDVRIFDIHTTSSEAETYINVTSFEANDIIVATALRDIAVSQVNITDSKGLLDFLIRNSLNDPFVKNDEISSLFLEVAQDTISETNKIIIIYVVLIIALIVLLTVLINLIIWRQYYKDKKNLLSLTKLNPLRISLLLKKFEKFQNVIQEKYTFSDLHNEEPIQSSKAHDNNKAEAYFKHRAKKGEHLSDSNSFGVYKKYLIYTAKWVIFLLLLAVLIILSSVPASQTGSYYQTKILQLNFANKMLTKINLAVVEVNELLALNNTITIQNVENLVGVENSINDIQTLRTELSSYLLEEDLLEDEIFSNILVSSTAGCKDLPALFISYCDVLDQDGISVNLVQLLTTLEMMLTWKMQAYIDSNKTTDALKYLFIEDYGAFISAKRVLSGQSSLLSETIDSKIEKYMEDARSNRTGIFIGFIIALLIIMTFSWTLILDQIKEANNRFKKILQIFPAEIVFSSFLLKTFLHNSSNGSLNSIKNLI